MKMKVTTRFGRFFPDVMLVAALLLAAIACCLFFWVFRDSNGLSSDAQQWSHFGDYIGGVVGPMVSIFALWAVIHAVKLQQKELESTRDELIQSRLAFQQQVEHFRLDTEISDLRAAVEHLERQLDEMLAKTGDESRLEVFILGYRPGLMDRLAMLKGSDADTLSYLQKWIFHDTIRVCVLFGFMAKLLYQLEIMRGQSHYVLAVKLKYNGVISRLHLLNYLYGAEPGYLMQFEPLPEVRIREGVTHSTF